MKEVDNDSQVGYEKGGDMHGKPPTHEHASDVGNCYVCSKSHYFKDWPKRSSFMLAQFQEDIKPYKYK